MKQLFIITAVILLSACGATTHDLIKQGDVQGVRTSLAKGTSVNDADNDYQRPLLGTAAFSGNYYVVDELINRGALVDMGDKWRQSPLDLASWQGHTNVAKRLIDAGTNVNSSDYKGRTPLQKAAGNGNVEIVGMLIKAGANINTQSNSGQTALHRGASAGNDKIVKLLLEAGADPNVRAGSSMDHWSPLHPACKKGNTRVIELLIEHGADVMYTDTTRWNGAHYAARYGGPNAIKTLARAVYQQKGPDAVRKLFSARAGKPNEWTPLHFAVRHNLIAETRALLEVGADPNVASNVTGPFESGWTALHLAATNERVELMKLLIAGGANPNLRTSRGDTAQAIYRQEMAEKNSGGLNFGQVMALAGGVALAGSSNLSGAQQAEFMTNYTADVLTDSGGTNMRNWGNQQVQQMASQRQNSQQGGLMSNQGAAQQQGTTGGQGAMKEADYSFTCPSGGSHSIKVPYLTTACLGAAKNFARVNGCNMVNEMSSASQRCSSSCGHPQCLESPAAGTTTGSGDAEMDFLNSMGQ